ncbi:hypothetical protein DID75_03010 [Candidatus Marinamargulisbacteria bacterium SCGC AG-410-N11]|nr:hypothetical protein DID75_03010 [Candidatus Marinamargulisbacteria bacterium SCGC AG-410-N11]
MKKIISAENNFDQEIIHILSKNEPNLEDHDSFEFNLDCLMEDDSTVDILPINDELDFNNVINNCAQDQNEALIMLCSTILFKISKLQELYNQALFNNEKKFILQLNVEKINDIGPVQQYLNDIDNDLSQRLNIAETSHPTWSNDYQI